MKSWTIIEDQLDTFDIKVNEFLKGRSEDSIYKTTFRTIVVHLGTKVVTRLSMNIIYHE
jgi:hypothetical protein